MQTIDKDLKVSKKVAQKAFEIKQAIVGLSLEENDEFLLKYFNFFVDKLPVKAASFAHIVPKFDLLYNLFSKDQPIIARQHELNDRILSQLQLEVHQEILDKPELDISYQVEEGSPSDQILFLAGDLSADLMIIGQKSGDSNHGILAKNLARSISFNALVVPEKAKHSITNILVPIDFSPSSVKTLQTALSIKKQLAHPVLITCIHVYELPGLAPYNLGQTEEAFRKIVKADREAAMNLFLSNYAHEEQKNIEKILSVATIKGIARDIYDHANENAIDLILIGSKGHSMVARMMMGSVTEKLLSVNKTIPTMIIR